MPDIHAALNAYRTVSSFRSNRAREADVFRQAATALELAQAGSPLQKVKALADNRVLWMTVGDLMRDPANALPAPLRGAVVSVGLSIQREMDKAEPDMGFLVTMNKEMAAGLAGG